MSDSTGVSFGFPFVHLCQFVQTNHQRPDFLGFVSPDFVVLYTMRVHFDQAAREIRRLSRRMSSSSVMLEGMTDSEGS